MSKLYATALLLLTLSATAQETGIEGSFHFSGDIQREVTLKLLDPGALEVVRVFSEPSRTLLAVFVNGGPDGRALAAGRAWLEKEYPGGKYPRRFPMATMGFEAGRSMTVNIPIPGAVDNRLSFQVVGRDSREYGFQVIGQRPQYAFTYTSRPGAGGGANVCCGPENGNSCERHCNDEGCKGNVFYCCWITECATSCGFCGQARSQCEPCPICGTC